MDFPHGVYLTACGIDVLLGVASLYLGGTSLAAKLEQDKAQQPDATPMKIEAVIVCVNYSDFLCWTLPNSKQHFDKLVVVTSKDDTKTQKLCEFWHVQCVVTDRMYEDGAVFNKGKAINEGLKALDGDGWVAHMDADIFLPPMFRTIVTDLKMDQAGLYTIDRLMCSDFKDWLRFYTEPPTSNEANIYVHLRPFPVGVRLAKKEYGGWLPLGFFQMWNQGVKKLAYPEEHTDAGRSDLLFSLQFDRDHRHLLGELIGVHLETKLDGEMGSNWKGRKTPTFGADVLGTMPAPVPAPAKPEAYQ